MSEITQYEDKIMYLATAFRTDFFQKDKFPCESLQSVDELKRIHHETKHYNEVSKFLDNEDVEEGIELPKTSSEVNVTDWNKAFSKLRPPVSATKRRQTQNRLKFTNKTCEEILQVVRTYKENLESEKERLKKDYAEEPNESLSFLWRNESDDAARDLYDEDFLAQISLTHDYSETPIPRNLKRF